MQSAPHAFRATPELLAQFQRVREDPWYWATLMVRTRDEVDKTAPVKKFPAHFDYLKLYFKLWQRFPRMAVPKSRRMFLSWSTIILYLHDTLFNSGRFNAFVSKKEEDSHALVERAKFILDNLDYSVIPKELIPQYEFKYCHLRFPEIDSKIVGFPEGADQLRQHTLSGIMADEAAFWNDATKMYAASMPTLEGGGRITMISSPGPGFFKKLVFDQLDLESAETSFEDRTLEPCPLEGIEIWKNRKNKFLVYQIHYTANPNKRSVGFKDAIRSSMPRAQYLQEYELQWDSFSGFPVYRDFDLKRHKAAIKPSPINGLPLLRGWDFGLTPACVIAQLQEDQLVILKEYVELNMGAERFSEKVLKDCALRWPEWGDQKKNWRDYIDPSGAFRKDTDEGTCAKILDSKGLAPIPGPVAFEERRQSVEFFLVRQTKVGPCFLIDAAECPILMKGFLGGYRYPEKSAEIEPNKIRPIKDEHSHPHDALQYIASRIMQMRQRPQRPIPILGYGWDKRA